MSYAAQETLGFLGGMMGYTLRNQILAIDASTIKMTGSVALSLMPYLLENTSFIDRFIDQDARCAYIPEGIAIELINNNRVAVEGSLILASRP